MYNSIQKPISTCWSNFCINYKSNSNTICRIDNITDLKCGRRSRCFASTSFQKTFQGAYYWNFINHKSRISKTLGNPFRSKVQSSRSFLQVIVYVICSEEAIAYCLLLDRWIKNWNSPRIIFCHSIGNCWRFKIACNLLWRSTSMVPRATIKNWSSLRISSNSASNLVIADIS